MRHHSISHVISLITILGILEGLHGQNVSTQARLVGGHSNGTGLLELFVDGEWTSVHRVYFTYNEAKVVCRMLGYNESVVKVFNNGDILFGSRSGSVLLHNFGCHGDEADLRQCGTSRWTPSASESHDADIGVSCERTQLRLMDGDDTHSGRVEFFFNGVWHSICDTSFDDDDARVICNSLGFSTSATARAYTKSHFGQGFGDAIISSLNCKGTEKDIKLCSGTWSPGACNHRNDAGVNCGGTQIRLANGPTNTSGRVEVYHGGKWGTICGYGGFDSRNAEVICRMLGISTMKAIAYQGAFYGEGYNQIIVSHLECDGSESDVAACQSDSWVVSGLPYSLCSHQNDVGVNCAGVTQIRLMDGVSEQSGRVEVFHNGHWGTIADNSFDNHDLVVICRMLGYEYNSQSFFMKGSFYGQGVGETIADTLQCNGGEEDIGHCSATWWPATRTTDHTHDVGVNCDGKIPIRLAGDSNSTSSGRVEILHNGQYGTICSQNFDRLDLIVVCRMLGIENIPQTAYWRKSASYSQGLGEMIVSNLKCNGIENNLGQCDGDWPANTAYQCDHGDDVYVNCRGDSETLRLVDGKNRHSGRVEILHDGRWATICDDSFDRADAVVICRILNFQTPEKAVAFTGSHFGSVNDTVDIAMSTLHCNGLETNLGQCSPTWDQNYCSHYRDIGVDCCPDCRTPAIVG